MSNTFTFCPYCGAPLGRGVAFGRTRPVCRFCGFIQFQDPKVAVAGLVSDGRKVLLVRRAAAPRIGFWALPAGYMDADELPEEALVREIGEETGLTVQVLGLHRVAPLAGWAERRGILLLYRAEPVSGTMAARDDASEVRWFDPDELPWDDLAFESTHQFLREWVASLNRVSPP